MRVNAARQCVLTHAVFRCVQSTEGAASLATTEEMKDFLALIAKVTDRPVPNLLRAHFLTLGAVLHHRERWASMRLYQLQRMLQVLKCRSIPVSWGID
jgi:hypothetical protein